MTDPEKIIAVLVRRLGGKVSISLTEVAEMRNSTVTVVQEPRFLGTTIEVEMPPIDAEFEVVGDVKLVADAR
jgi:hypothetical protein